MNTNAHTSNFTIEVESVLEPIVPDFLNSRQKDCLLIQQMLEQDAFDEIRIIGHRMKGSGGSYGFDDISEIGEIMEDASLKADHEKIRAAIQRLAKYLERVSVVYV